MLSNIKNLAIYPLFFLSSLPESSRETAILFANPNEKVFVNSLFIYGGVILFAVIAIFGLIAIFTNTYYKRKGMNYVFVHQFMAKNAFLLDAKATVDDAMDFRLRHKVDYLPVVEELNLVKGVITKKDWENISKESFLSAYSKKPILEIISKDFYYLNTHDTLEKTINYMATNNCEWVPVVDGHKRIVGVVTYKEVVNSVSDYLNNKG